MVRESTARSGFWGYILPRISQGIFIPIVSDSFRIEQIFRDGSETTGDENALSLYEQLVSEWGTLIGYPMEDRHNLARVSQYYLVEQKDDPHARSKFLEFLKSFLLTIASEDVSYNDLAVRLKTKVHEMRLSEIVQQLDYPRFPEGTDDPLRLLAKLPLPIYVTTSQSNFLERALEAEDKKPRTQVCFWSGEIASTNPDHQTDPEFTPTVTAPMVYHLFGLEDYPQTLVQSEDDYISFIMSMAEDTSTLNPIVPLSLRRALGESNLVLLGYRLQDWEFRILFRFILKFRRDEFSPRGLVIQLREEGRKTEDMQKSLEYLGRYFDRKKFDIEWANAETFIQRLWSEWNTYRRGRS